MQPLTRCLRKIVVISSFAPSSILNREFDSLIAGWKAEKTLLPWIPLLGPGSSYFQARLRRRGLHLEGGGGEDRVREAQEKPVRSYGTPEII